METALQYLKDFGLLVTVANACVDLWKKLRSKSR
jgi:hypothetical protein